MSDTLSNSDEKVRWGVRRIVPESRYEILGQEIGKTVTEKNEAYGDSFAKSGQVLRIMYPKGIMPAEYDDMLAIIRIVDKLFRIATDRDALGESPFLDIAGYGILGASRSTHGNEPTGTV